MPIPQQIFETIDWLIKIEDFKLAQNLALKACSYAPKNTIELNDYLAMVFFKTKDFKTAVKYAENTAAMAPQNSDALFNLSKCNYYSGRPSEAIRNIDQVLKLRPHWIDALVEKSVYLHAQGSYKEAEDILLNLLELEDINEQQKNILLFNMGWHLIQNGRFKEGMANLRIGRELGIWGRKHRHMTIPLLENVDNLHKKTVLVLGEGGAGDEIINSRFASHLQSKGATVIWITGHSLEKILASVPGIAKVIQPAEIKNIQADYYAPAMDLSTILKLELKDVFCGNYIRANSSVVKKYKQKFGEKTKLRVGIRWQGNQLYEHDLYRSVPFSHFGTFFKNNQIQFYSLQRDTGLDEFDPASGVIDLSNDLKTWEDTAAIISCLDLVITSCTSIAHLAGALGVKTWVFCPINCYYIWATPEDKSPWYSDVTLFRQTKHNQWLDVAEKMTPPLQNASVQKRQPTF